MLLLLVVDEKLGAFVVTELAAGVETGLGIIVVFARDEAGERDGDG